jgi:hypothetical protein
MSISELATSPGQLSPVPPKITSPFIAGNIMVLISFLSYVVVGMIRFFHDEFYGASRKPGQLADTVHILTKSRCV